MALLNRRHSYFAHVASRSCDVTHPRDQAGESAAVVRAAEHLAVAQPDTGPSSLTITSASVVVAGGSPTCKSAYLRTSTVSSAALLAWPHAELAQCPSASNRSAVDQPRACRSGAR
jgi:hypothetical protein